MTLTVTHITACVFDTNLSLKLNGTIVFLEENLEDTEIL